MSASLMHGTSNVRVPSLFSWSTARPSPTCLWWMTPGLPGAVGVRDEGGVQRRHVVQGAHDRVADDVREAHLGARRPRQLVVQDEPVDLEQAGRHAAHAGRRRHRQAGLHVGDDPRRGAPQRDGILASRRNGGSRSRGGDRREARRMSRVVPPRVSPPEPARRPDPPAAPAQGPDGSPRRTRASSPRPSRGRREAVVHVVDQPCVGAERAACAAELGHGPTLPAAVGPQGRAGSVCPAHDLSSGPPLRVAAGARIGHHRVFVHGSLDRGESFRRVMRRLPEFGSWRTTGADIRGRERAGADGPRRPHR